MDDTQISSLPLSKEMLERPPQEIVGLLVRLMSRVEELECLLRFPVIWRKRSFGTPTRQGEELVGRLLSLRKTCRLQGKRAHFCLVEAFEHYSFWSRPAGLFSSVRDACHRVNSARSLLSLKLSIFTATKTVLAVLCQGCFLSFSGSTAWRGTPQNSDRCVSYT